MDFLFRMEDLTLSKSIELLEEEEARVDDDDDDDDAGLPPELIKTSPTKHIPWSTLRDTSGFSTERYVISHLVSILFDSPGDSLDHFSSASPMDIGPSFSTNKRRSIPLVLESTHSLSNISCSIFVGFDDDFTTCIHLGATMRVPITSVKASDTIPMAFDMSPSEGITVESSHPPFLTVRAKADFAAQLSKSPPN
jgi:hypothetical protein